MAENDFVPTTSERMTDIFDESNLTTNQVIFWVGQKLYPDVPLYNLASNFRIKGKIDPQLFQQAFQTLLNSSDVLRTVFIAKKGIPQRRILNEFLYSMDYMDFTGHDDPEAKFNDWVDKRSRILFDLKKCLFDTALIKLSDEEFVWFLKQHHIICDATSAVLIFRHLSDLYRLSIAERLPEKIDLPSFQEYVRYEREQRSTACYRKAADYWSHKLNEEIEPIMFHGKTPVKTTTRVRRISLELGANRSQRLKMIAKQEGLFFKTLNVSLFNIFAALLLTHLHRISGNRRLSLGMALHNRRRKEFKKALGLFMKILPLRVSIEENDTLMSLIGKLASGAAETLKYCEYTIPNTIVNPVYDVVLNYQVVSFSEFNGYRMDHEWLHFGHGNESVVLHVHDFDDTGNFVLLLDLHSDIFDNYQQKQAAEQFLQLIDGFLENSSQLVREVDLLSERERQVLLMGWNRTDLPFPEDWTIQRCFEEQVARTPDVPALSYRDKTWTYHKLDQRAETIAQQLREAGARPESIIGICMERCLDLVAGMLGILKTGAAYLPLDPTYPSDRLAFMIEDARPLLVVSNQRARERLSKVDVRILSVDGNIAAGGSNSFSSHREESYREESLGGSNLAYVIYTSGSTGKPKGVMVEHRSIMNLFAGMDDVYGRDPGVCLAVTSVSFDPSVLDLFWTLTRGYHVVIWPGVDEEHDMSIPELIHAYGVTYIGTVPSFIRMVMMLPGGTDALASLRLIQVGGESLSTNLIHDLGPSLSRRIVNAYGLTETTVISTVWEVDPKAATIPIGRPIANTQIFVLDPLRRPVPVGVVGELYIGGAGVARGYLNRPELTEGKFIQNPFAGKSSERLYRTGDLVRYRPDGMLEFIGRTDDQVKVRGFRVEPGEIEAVLSEHPDLREVVVDVQDTEKCGKRLVAYVVPEKKGMPLVKENSAGGGPKTARIHGSRGVCRAGRNTAEC